MKPLARISAGGLVFMGIVQCAVTGRMYDLASAEAQLDGQRVVVRSGNVPEPVAVRYAYATDPRHCHLYNRDGLPAAPFCSHPELLHVDPAIPTD